MSDFHEPSYAAGFDEGWRTAANPDLGDRVVRASEAEALAEALGACIEAHYAPRNGKDLMRLAIAGAQDTRREYRSRHPKATDSACTRDELSVADQSGETP